MGTSPSPRLAANGLLTFDHVSGQTYTFTIDSASGGLTGFAGGGSESNIGAAMYSLDYRSLAGLDGLVPEFCLEA